ncbi:serine/arginine repetitive matrix protein 2-like [Topomyia yanbarensis]|uniref:serine/arginine repetitive matrix protein 2-like n=1 Tax=Topomyia yanbarensis TaxID=2498891 RepID=UPI00273AF7F5|nr:serine/arginine repetitive matrix protein 2-like [Topomyia yanbarensis]
MSTSILPVIIKILEESGEEGLHTRTLLAKVRDLPGIRSVPPRNIRQAFDDKLKIANDCGLVTQREDRVRLAVNCHSPEGPSFYSALENLERNFHELQPQSDAVAASASKRYPQRERSMTRTVTNGSGAPNRRAAVRTSARSSTQPAPGRSRSRSSSSRRQPRSRRQSASRSVTNVSPPPNRKAAARGSTQPTTSRRSRSRSSGSGRQSRSRRQSTSRSRR